MIFLELVPWVLWLLVLVEVILVLQIQPLVLRTWRRIVQGVLRVADVSGDRRAPVVGEGSSLMLGLIIRVDYEDLVGHLSLADHVRILQLAKVRHQSLDELVGVSPLLANLPHLCQAEHLLESLAEWVLLQVGFLAGGSGVLQVEVGLDALVFGG